MKPYDDSVSPPSLLALGFFLRYPLHSDVSPFVLYLAPACAFVSNCRLRLCLCLCRLVPCSRSFPQNLGFASLDDVRKARITPEPTPHSISSISLPFPHLTRKERKKREKNPSILFFFFFFFSFLVLHLRLSKPPQVSSKSKKRKEKRVYPKVSKEKYSAVCFCPLSYPSTFTTIISSSFSKPVYL